LDNRIVFSPTNVTQNESAYYDFISAESIKELVEEKGASAYTTEKEKAFKAMADTLKFDDNEVVGILHVDW
jgi:predicted oxidoreductase (fatty acid repression mutant protein)